MGRIALSPHSGRDCILRRPQTGATGQPTTLTYSQLPSFTWLDFAESDRQRAQDVIDLFREQDTRDELGIATIRDSLSDWFFPGTSAIQTRARYFLIIPWTYLRLEAKRVASAEVARRARDEELKLIDVLADCEDELGTIGVRARRTLKRLPSGVYWQGLQRLRILAFPGSRDQYHRSLDGFYLRRDAASVRNDDGEVVSASRTRNWHADLPKPPRGFPQVCTLALQREEADYLRERIMYAAPASLFARLVDGGEAAPETDFPWEIPVLPRLPEPLRRDIDHARHFSELMLGASLLYNVMLAEMKGDPDRVADFGGRMEAWTADCVERRSDHEAWRIDGLWELAGRAQGRVPPLTRAFVTSWVELVRQNFGRDLGAHEGARGLVKARERQLKRALSRFDNRRSLEMWGGDSGSRQIDYRWNAIVKQVVRDIHEGLER